MTISIHKLGRVSAATTFIPGSTSNQQLAVKISGKNSKACKHGKCSKQNMLKQRWNYPEQTTIVLNLTFLQRCLNTIINTL